MASDERNTQFMDQLKNLSNKLRFSGPGGSDMRVSFAKIRHCVGRLAHQVRVPQYLLAKAHRLSTILLHSFDVQPIKGLVRECRPHVNRTIDLEEVFKRIPGFLGCPPETVREAIKEMHQAISERDNWGLDRDKNTTPKRMVHAEIQVLEYFYREKLLWLKDDRYIGCSKDCCLCCALYINHHPAEVVKLRSHRKFYIKWGLPELSIDGSEPWYEDFLSKILKGLIKSCLDQFLRRSGIPWPWKPDSTTGLTKTGDGSIRQNQDLPLEGELRFIMAAIQSC
jgi:hypothetical protein